MDESIKPLETPPAEPQEEGTVPQLNGHKPGNAAENIMADPAAVAMAVTPEVLIQRTLQALPGLVGAIDHAIRDQTGKHQPFVLLVFAEGTALHSANFDPKVAQKAVIELASRWDLGEQAVVVSGDTPAGDIPSEGGGGGEPAANDGETSPHVTH